MANTTINFSGSNIVMIINQLDNSWSVINSAESAESFIKTVGNGRLFYRSRSGRSGSFNIKLPCVYKTITMNHLHGMETKAYGESFLSPTFYQYKGEFVCTSHCTNGGKLAINERNEVDYNLENYEKKTIKYFFVNYYGEVIEKSIEIFWKGYKKINPSIKRHLIASELKGCPTLNVTDFEVCFGRNDIRKNEGTYYKVNSFEQNLVAVKKYASLEECAVENGIILNVEKTAYLEREDLDDNDNGFKPVFKWVDIETHHEEVISKNSQEQDEIDPEME